MKLFPAALSMKERQANVAVALAIWRILCGLGGGDNAFEDWPWASPARRYKYISRRNRRYAYDTPQNESVQIMWRPTNTHAPNVSTHVLCLKNHILSYHGNDCDVLNVALCSSGFPSALVNQFATISVSNSCRLITYTRHTCMCIYLYIFYIILFGFLLHSIFTKSGACFGWGMKQIMGIA